MPSPRAALRLIGAELGRRVRAVSYDPAAITKWEEGDLSGKLRVCQKRIKEAVRAKMAGDLANRALKFILHCSRRLGKTFWMLTDACEIGIREMNAPLKFAGPTREQIKNIARPIFREITMDCPEQLRPVWRSSDHLYLFPKTHTELVMEGCSKGHEENLRGMACRKAYVDEAQAFKNNLKYVVQDILMPQLLTTGGSMLIAGTSPKTPVHDFVKLISEAKVRGNYIDLPIWDAGYEEDLVEKFCEEAGGAESTTWRREYLNEILVDEASAIIPEWQKKKHVLVRKPQRDEYWTFYHKYEAMDIGGRRDRTAVLFYWYDFRRAKLCIDVEFGIEPARMTTQAIADGVKKAERQAFPGLVGVDSRNILPLKLRIADNNNEILLKDLGLMHGLHFAPTTKDTLEAMVNKVRLWVGAERIEVSPECVELLGCLDFGIWNERRDNFERFPEDSDAHRIYGHFDMLAALVYAVRNVDEITNPIPPDFKLDRREMFVPPAGKSQEAQVMTKLLGPRFRR